MIPDGFFLIEAEREVLAGAFRAAIILDEHPDHEAAREALALVTEFSSKDFGYREHRQILEAQQAVFARAGTLAPALVLQELRARRHFDAIRLLPSCIDYGLAPVAAMPHHLLAITKAAWARERWQAAQDELAQLTEESAWPT